MTYDISKDFTFSAAHRLSGLPKDHQCSRLHGHNYIVQVVLTNIRIHGPGFVRDYGEMNEFKDHLDAHFEHKYLGYGKLLVKDEAGFGAMIDPVVTFNPTAENLAHHFFRVVRDHLDFPEVSAVGVSETPKVWAWYKENK